MVFQTQRAESIIYYQCGRVEIAWLSPEVWKAEAIFHYPEVLMSLVVEWEDMMSLNLGVIDSSPDPSKCWKSICDLLWQTVATSSWLTTWNAVTSVIVQWGLAWGSALQLNRNPCIFDLVTLPLPVVYRALLTFQEKKRRRTWKIVQGVCRLDIHVDYLFLSTCPFARH